MAGKLWMIPIQIVCPTARKTPILIMRKRERRSREQLSIKKRGLRLQKNSRISAQTTEVAALTSSQERAICFTNLSSKNQVETILGMEAPLSWRKTMMEVVT
jgi:hypothetical protein